jgi:hypothetical protein
MVEVIRHVSLDIRFPNTPAPTPSDIYRVRKWGDPVVADLMGGDTNMLPKPDEGNFQVIQTASIGGDGKPFFNCINRFQKDLPLSYLESIQYPSEGYTVSQKMNWLINYPTHGVSPYWMKDSPTLYFGPLVFGGQLVQLGEQITVNGKYPNRDKFEPITFRRVIGVRKSELGKYTYTTRPDKIQRATSAHHPNIYSQHPKGEIFHPVWSDIDWPTNYGDGKMWLAVRLLEN